MSTKPHEVGLSVMQFDKERRCLVEDGQRMVAVMRNYDAAEWEALLTAAPDMARALLEMRRMARGTIGHGIGCTCPVCVGSEAALRKAGVLS